MPDFCFDVPYIELAINLALLCMTRTVNRLDLAKLCMELQYTCNVKYFSAVKEGDQKDHLPRVLRQERAKKVLLNLLQIR